MKIHVIPFPLYNLQIFCKFVNSNILRLSGEIPSTIGPIGAKIEGVKDGLDKADTMQNFCTQDLVLPPFSP